MDIENLSNEIIERARYLSSLASKALSLDEGFEKYIKDIPEEVKKARIAASANEDSSDSRVIETFIPKAGEEDFRPSGSESALWANESRMDNVNKEDYEIGKVINLNGKTARIVNDTFRKDWKNLDYRLVEYSDGTKEQVSLDVLDQFNKSNVDNNITASFYSENVRKGKKYIKEEVDKMNNDKKNMKKAESEYVDPNKAAYTDRGDYGSPGEVFDEDAGRTRQTDTSKVDPKVQKGDNQAVLDRGEYKLEGSDVVTKDAQVNTLFETAAANIDTALDIEEKKERKRAILDIVRGAFAKAKNAAFRGNPNTAVDRGDYGAFDDPFDAENAQNLGRDAESRVDIEKQRSVGSFVGETQNLIDVRKVSRLQRAASIVFNLGALEVVASVRKLKPEEISNVVNILKSAEELPVIADWNTASNVDKAIASIKNYMIRDPKVNKQTIASIIADVWRFSDAEATELQKRLKTAVRLSTGQAMDLGNVDFAELSVEALKAAFSAEVDPAKKEKIQNEIGKRVVSGAFIPRRRAISTSAASGKKSPILSYITNRVDKGMPLKDAIAEAKKVFGRSTDVSKTSISKNPDIQEGTKHKLESEATGKLADEENRKQGKEFDQELKLAWKTRYHDFARKSADLVNAGKYSLKQVIDSIPADLDEATRKLAIREIFKQVTGKKPIPKEADHNDEDVCKYCNGKGCKHCVPKENMEKDSMTSKDVSEDENKKQEADFTKELKTASKMVKEAGYTAILDEKQTTWKVYNPEVMKSFKRIGSIDLADVDLEDVQQEFNLGSVEDASAFMTSDAGGKTIIDQFKKVVETKEAMGMEDKEVKKDVKDEKELSPIEKARKALEEKRKSKSKEKGKGTEVAEDKGEEVSVPAKKSNPTPWKVGSKVKIAESWLPTGEETEDLIHDITQIRDSGLEGEVVDVNNEEVEVEFAPESPNIILNKAELVLVKSAHPEDYETTEGEGGTDNLWSEDTVETGLSEGEVQRREYLGEQSGSSFAPDAGGSQRVVSSLQKKIGSLKYKLARNLAEQMFGKRMIKGADEIVDPTQIEKVIEDKAQDLLKLNDEGFYELEAAVKSSKDPVGPVYAQKAALRTPITVRGPAPLRDKDPIENPDFWEN